MLVEMGRRKDLSIIAMISTLAGVAFSLQSELVLMDTKLPLLNPYGWLTLGY